MAEIAGNLSPNNADFLPQFKAIGQGLKKRFFRKPNVAEAIEQYEELAMELQRETQTEFSAICYTEAAKCHEPLKNSIQQANLLLKSGRLYLTARNARRFYQDGYNNLFFRPESLHSAISGNTQLAVQHLSQAAKIYQRENFYGLSVLITLEIAQSLFKEGSYGEALKYYRSALDICRSHFIYLDQVLVTEYMIRCKLEMTDYDSALKMVNDTLIGIRNCTEEDISPETKVKLLNGLEITRVCLLMLLGTNTVDVLGFIWPELNEGKHSESSVSSLQQQSTSFPSPGLKTISASSGNRLSASIECDNEMRSVQIHLKSLVIAVQHGSADEIEDVRSHLAPIMQQCHHDLLGMLIKSLS